MNPLPEKACAVCGRRMVWRAKWRDVWEEVRYCSERCRRGRSGGEGDAVEAAILEGLGAIKRGGSICPSEVARRLFPETWRDEMETVRMAARRLVARGRIEITQAGRAVDPSTAKGPIRLRLRGGSGSGLP